MIFIIIKDAKGKELVKNEVTVDIPQDLLEYAAGLTVESHNMEFPENKWETITVDSEAPIEKKSTKKT
jgi:hypothetical protein